MASVFLGVVALAGCALLDQRPAKEVVLERAQARWDALVKGDVKSAYAYFSPVAREAMTLDAYSGSIRVGFWKSVKVNEVICESATVCDAHSMVEYVYRGSKVVTPLKETWIKEGLTWWYVQK